MGRRIVTTQYQSTGGSVDTYFDRVVKYIPADIVSAWIAVTGLISSGKDVPVNLLLWIAFVLCAILTAVWTLKQTSVKDKNPAWTQIALSTVSFIIWVFALGGPFATLGFYRPLYGSLLLIFYTLVIGLVIPPEK